MMNKKFVLFASCILVKGKKKSIIYDLQRNFFYPIPNTLAIIIENYQGKSLSYIKSKFDNQYEEIIDEYFNFLKDNELIFFTSQPELFPSLPMEWDHPFIITNAIIDIKEEIIYSIKFIQELKPIGCHSLQIRIFATLAVEKIEKILEVIDRGRISSVELVIKYTPLITINYLKELCGKFHRLSIVTVYGAPNQSIHHVRSNRFGNIFFITNMIDSDKCCGQIKLSTFTINVKTFTESLQFNSCLNRKISIDTAGNIKNCPSMAKSYGNIQNNTLDTVLSNPDFKQPWHINKDMIHVCQDCEFRYMCTDCRAFIEDPSDLYSKPLKCGYNPYTGEWSKWSTSPLKQKAIEYYGMQELVKFDQH